MNLGFLCLLTFLGTSRGFELNRQQRWATFYPLYLSEEDLPEENKGWDYQYNGYSASGRSDLPEEYNSRDYQYNGYKASGRLTSAQSTPDDRYNSG